MRVRGKILMVNLPGWREGPGKKPAGIFLCTNARGWGANGPQGRGRGGSLTRSKSSSSMLEAEQSVDGSVSVTDRSSG